MTKLQTTMSVEERNISAGYAPKSDISVKRKRKQIIAELNLAFLPEI